MAQGRMPREKAAALFAAIEDALKAGHSPPGVPVKSGKKGAVRIALDKLGYRASGQTSALGAAKNAMGREPDWSLWKQGTPSFMVPQLPSYQATAEEIIKRKFTIFNRRKKAQDARDLIKVPVTIDGPIGILHMGDPHLDDDGTNIQLVIDHLELPNKVEGLFRACVGDYLNNWRGKLAHLHAGQTTTQQEALKLLEWFIKREGWLYLIAGNHDVWAGDEDPNIWFTRGIGSIYEWHGARIALQFPNRKEQIINVRHEWPGSSIYNRVQGATKAIRFGGTDCLYINGHKHIWAQYTEENKTGDVSHAVQVSAYKEVDDFPRARGMQQTRLGAACLTIHDPNARTPHGSCQVFWDIDLGADVLKSMRRRKAA